MSNQGGGGAKCVNLFLFVATIMFIIDSSTRIKGLKPDEEYAIACQTKVLTWIGFSFFNYYAFMLVAFCLYSHTSERESHKRFRFRTGLFLALVLVPFMISWNIYGNVMIKQEYFESAGEATGDQAPKQSGPTSG